MDVPVNWRDWVILVYVLLKLAQDWLILRGRISWPSPLAFFPLSHTHKKCYSQAPAYQSWVKVLAVT